MSRKNRAPKRDVLPDPLYNSQLVTRLINRVMLDGKRGTAASIVYGAFEQIKEATGNDALVWLKLTVHSHTSVGNIGCESVKKVPEKIGNQSRLRLQPMRFIFFSRLLA